jgi:hypothetical protein
VSAGKREGGSRRAKEEGGQGKRKERGSPWEERTALGREQGSYARERRSCAG